MNDLSEICFTYVESMNEIGLIKRGESGYYRTEYAPLDNTLDTKAFVKELNKRLGLSDEEIIAMEIGSMFGWDVPGANPDSWRGEVHE